MRHQNFEKSNLRNQILVAYSQVVIVYFSQLSLQKVGLCVYNTCSKKHLSLLQGHYDVDINVWFSSLSPHKTTNAAEMKYIENTCNINLKNMLGWLPFFILYVKLRKLGKD